LANDIPPPPPGFTLDAQPGAVPPPPPGFKLDSQQPPPAKPESGLDIAKDFASAAVRPLVKGVAALPLMAMDAGVAARNLVTGNVDTSSAKSLLFGSEKNKGAAELPSEEFNRQLDARTRKPTTTAGKVAEEISSALVGGKIIPSAPGGAAKALAPEVAKARAAGYVLPVSTARPNLLNKVIEGTSGKIQMAQQASVKNQENTNRLVRKAIGLAEDAPITKESLAMVRQQAGKAYEALEAIPTPMKITPKFTADVQKVSGAWDKVAQKYPEIAKLPEVDALKTALTRHAEMTFEEAVQLTRALRAKATGNLKNFANPEKVAEGKAQQAASKAIEDLMEQNLAASGNKQLLTQFREARQLYAKTHDVESALNDATGNVNAAHLAKLLHKGKLTGELKTVAEVAKGFEKATQRPEKIGSTPGFSPLDVATTLISSAASPAHAGKRIAEAALTLGARPALRKAALSKLGQKVLVDNPSTGIRRSAGRYTLAELAQREQSQDEGK
jgi:hypothetical protein